jgi:hypothetical protein
MGGAAGHVHQLDAEVRILKSLFHHPHFVISRTSLRRGPALSASTALQAWRDIIS